MLLLLAACSSERLELAEPYAAMDAEALPADQDESARAADYSVWDGTRRFSYDDADGGWYCDETIAESGFALERDSDAWAELRDACPDCEAFYEVLADRDEVCDWIPLGTSWRGVDFEDGAADVRVFYAEDGHPIECARDHDASFDGVALAYAYSFATYEVARVDVNGAVSFPLQ